MNRKLMERGVTLILKGMGLDLADPNYKDTPKRVAKMFEEMLTPAESRWAAFPAQQNDFIILRNHKVVALCPHHLQPVEIVANVGYLPNKHVVGLSKLARVVEVQLDKPMLQEDLADAIVNSLEAKIRPKGVGVVLVGVHGCMRYRGVESLGDVVTSVMRGVLLLNPVARAEFLQLIGRP